MKNFKLIIFSSLIFLFGCRAFSDHILISENLANDIIIGKSNSYEGIWHLKRIDSTDVELLGIGFILFPNPYEVCKCDSFILGKNKKSYLILYLDKNNNPNDLKRFRNIEKFQQEKINLKIDENNCVKIYEK